ncbi:MAG: hypothetical protein HZB65_00990 [Candidatus Aenigmarchaeota archaeon]|nr:hypothetical protein [Candidatus Aenigmarchaeota archaeon]
MKSIDIIKSGMFYWMQESYMALRKHKNGIKQWQELMDKGLCAGYEKQCAKRGSGAKGFLKHVIARDRLLGLEAGGGIMARKGKQITKFSYWIECPFAVLKDRIGVEEYEEISTKGYLATKIRYFLGDGWVASVVKSPWLGDKRTEWVVEKIGYSKPTKDSGHELWVCI